MLMKDFPAQISATIPIIFDSSQTEYQILHKNDTRIRLRVPKLTTDAEYARKVQHSVESIDCVISVHINAWLLTQM